MHRNIVWCILSSTYTGPYYIHERPGKKPFYISSFVADHCTTYIYMYILHVYNALIRSFVFSYVKTDQTHASVSIVQRPSRQTRIAPETCDLTAAGHAGPGTTKSRPYSERRRALTKLTMTHDWRRKRYHGLFPRCFNTISVFYKSSYVLIILDFSL